jgi:hypothetical protein
MKKFTGLTLNYCAAFTAVKFTLTTAPLPPSINFELTLNQKKRFTFLRLVKNLYIVILSSKIFLLSQSFTITRFY